jgi:hypothetical protein
VNPHDPTKRPGAHLVAAELNIDNPADLVEHYPPRDPLGAMGWMVAAAADEVDALHATLTDRARLAITILEPVSRGSHDNMHGSYGVLADLGPQMELLATRRGAAYAHLHRAVSVYQRLLPDTVEAVSAGLDRERERAAEQAPGHDDDWALAGDRQIEALRAVARGGLRLKQSALSEQDRYLSDGTGVLVPVWARTVERMLTDGLLDVDNSTKATQGQLLSLTPLGQEALRAAQDLAAATTTGQSATPAREAGSLAATPGPHPPPPEERSADEAAFHAGHTPDPLTTAALSRSTRITRATPPAEPSPVHAADPAQPAHTR